MKGGTAAYYDRNVKRIADNTYMHGRTETIDDIEYQVRYLANEEVLAKIGNDEYPSIQAAANAAEDGDEIDLVADNYIFSTLTFPADKKITLDLNGFEIIDGNQIINKGDVTIYDSTGEPHLLDYREANYFITNEANAKLRITGIDIRARFAIYNKKDGEVALNDLKIGKTSKSETAIENYGKLSLNYAEIYATYRAIYSSGGSLNIANSTLDTTNAAGDKYTLYAVNSQLTMSDTTILADSADNTYNAFAIYFDNSTGTISSTNVKEDSHGHWRGGGSYHTAYYQTNSTNITATDSTFDGYTRIANGTFSFADGVLEKTTASSYNRPLVYNSGNTTITNTPLSLTQIGNSAGEQYASIIINTNTLTLDNTAITNKLDYDAYYHESRIIANSGTININNATISQEYGAPHYNYTNNGTTYGIYNTGTVNYTDSTITIGRINAYGIYAESGNVNIKSGTVFANGATNSFGLWVKNGTITLGEAEPEDSINYGTANAVVSTESPLIQAYGATNGIGITLEAGNFNFYDGKIVQNSTIGPAVQADHASKATITNVEYLYQPETHTDDEGHTYFILEFMR